MLRTPYSPDFIMLYFQFCHKAVEIHGMPCPLIRPFLWEPWGRDQCDNVTCEPALYGLDKDSSDIEEFTKQTGEAVISVQRYV